MYQYIMTRSSRNKSADIEHVVNEVTRHPSGECWKSCQLRH